MDSCGIHSERMIHVSEGVDQLRTWVEAVTADRILPTFILRRTKPTETIGSFLFDPKLESKNDLVESIIDAAACHAAACIGDTAFEVYTVDAPGGPIMGFTLHVADSAEPAPSKREPTEKQGITDKMIETLRDLVEVARDHARHLKRENKLLRKENRRLQNENDMLQRRSIRRSTR